MNLSEKSPGHNSFGSCWGMAKVPRLTNTFSRETKEDHDYHHCSHQHQKHQICHHPKHQHQQQRCHKSRFESCKPLIESYQCSGALLAFLVLCMGLLCQIPVSSALPTPPPAPTGDGVNEAAWGDSALPSHHFNNLAHGLVMTLPQRLGLVDNSNSENCTDCDVEAFDRQTFEKIKLEQIQNELLMRLNMGKPPNVSRVTTENAFNKPVSRFLNREREELRQNHQQRFGNSNYAKISEIVSYGEEATNFSDNAMVMFRLSTSAEREGTLKVMSASLYMLLRYRNRKHHSNGHDKPRRRVKVNIYPVYPDQSQRDMEGDNKTMFGSLGVMVRHTRWQKLILPVSEIQKVVDSNSKVLHLRITCDNCGNDIEPVLAARRSHSRRKVRDGWKRKMNKRRPLLIIHTAVEGDNEDDDDSMDMIQQHNAQRRRRHVIHKRLAPVWKPEEGECDLSPLSRGKEKKTPCTVRKLWVSFKDIGWDEWILFPKGYYANYCDGSCPLYQAPDDDYFGTVFKGKNKFYHKPSNRRREYRYQRRPGRRYSHHHRKGSYQAYRQVVGEYSKLATPRRSDFRKSRPQRWNQRQRKPQVGPCCQPRSMSGLNLIYFDENGNIVKTLLRNMGVESCGCV